MGKSNIFSGGISAQSASLRKNVSVATIYRWIACGKINAEKRGGRYYIALDSKFRKAKKYQRTKKTKASILRKNSLLRQQILDWKCVCHELSEAYETALQRIETLEKQMNKWRAMELFEKSSATMKQYQEYRKRKFSQNSNASDASDWECPIPIPKAEKPEWIYNENTRTIEMLSDTKEY